MLFVTKLKTEEGPLKNLRPINLLNSIQKTFSIVSLNIIKDKVEDYISASQAVNCGRRSTGVIIWAHKFIAAKVQKYQDVKAHIIGRNISSALGTMNRNDLIQELETFLEDKYRMTRPLFSNTTINIKFRDISGHYVKKNVESSQGDAISRTFFKIALYNILITLIKEMNGRKPATEHLYTKRLSIPDKLIYADDSDFPTVGESKKGHLKYRKKKERKL